MNTLKRAGAVLIVLLVGVLFGAWGMGNLQRPQFDFMVAATEERDLRENVMLLKILDDGKVDLAKSMLESSIQSSLNSAPDTLTHANDPRMRKILDETLSMARLALADRTKSYTQLQKEIGK